MLVLSRKLNEGIRVGSSIVIVSAITRSHVRVAVHADKTVPVIRLSPEEVQEAIHAKVDQETR